MTAASALADSFSCKVVTDINEQNIYGFNMYALGVPFIQVVDDKLPAKVHNHCPELMFAQMG